MSEVKLQKAIFLDRDGVINKWEEPEDKDYGPNWYCLSWYDFEFLPGVFEAFNLIKESDYIPIIISNQSCIGKGYSEEESIYHIFDRMEHCIWKQTGIELNFYFCSHDTDQGCACRKPSPGMLYQAAIEHDIDLSQSWMIGDSITDIQAGKNAGIRNLLKIHRSGDPIGNGHPQLCYNVTTNLLAAIEYILTRKYELDATSKS